MTTQVFIPAQAMALLRPLLDHLCRHESDSAGHAYDPVKSPRLVEPLLVKNAFNPDVFGDALLFELFEGMSAQAERAIGGLFRVYIDGMLSPRYENEVLFNMPRAHEGFEEFLNRVTDGRKFGVVINGAEQWSDALARLAARVFAPLVEAQGASRSTIEVTLFIGNYGYTPFGIHIDDPYTSVVHFHLGPGSKAMTLFDKANFHRINGQRKNCFEPERLISHGRTFDIAPGDAFLLPPHWYHVGNTNCFSIGVACAVSKYPWPMVCDHMLKRAITEEPMLGSVAKVIAHAQASGCSLASWLQRSEREYLARAGSRCQLRYAWMRNTHSTVEPDAHWVRDPDFPLTTLEMDDDLLVFVRGHRVRLARTDASTRLLQALPHNAFSARQLYQMLAGKVSLDAVRATLSQLIRFGGLHSVQAAS